MICVGGVCERREGTAGRRAHGEVVDVELHGGGRSLARTVPWQLALTAPTALPNACSGRTSGATGGTTTGGTGVQAETTALAVGSVPTARSIAAVLV